MDKTQLFQEIASIERPWMDLAKGGIDLLAMRDKAPLAFSRWLALRRECRAHGWALP